MSEGTELEVVRCGQRDWIDQGLKSLLVHMSSLDGDERRVSVNFSLSLSRFTRSSSLRLCRPMALGTPAERLPVEIP